MNVVPDHGIIGGNHANTIVVAIRYARDGPYDSTAFVCGFSPQLNGIVEVAIGIGKLGNDFIWSIIEIIGRHGSRKREVNANGFIGLELGLVKVAQPKCRLVNQQNIIDVQIIAGAARARCFIGGRCKKDVAHIGAGTIVVERDAQTTPCVSAIGG